MKNMITLLEELAHRPAYQLQSLPQHLQTIFATNNVAALQKQISTNESFAHESHVFTLDNLC
jgi:hypothetical protein